MTAKKAVESYFSCYQTRDYLGTWTCETNIDATGGSQPLDLHISLTYHPILLVGGVVKYTFKAPGTRMIRDTSFHRLTEIAHFFGDDVARALNTHENYKTYVRGQDLYDIRGLTFEAFDSSTGFTLVVYETSQKRISYFPFSKLAPDNSSCVQSDGLLGWNASWSDSHAYIEPALYPVSLDLKMLTGRFWLREDGVMFWFKEALDPLAVEASSTYVDPNGPNNFGNFVTLLVDAEPIYQGQWGEMHAQACCAQSVQPLMTSDLLHKMGLGRRGTIILSEDANRQIVIAASDFDLANTSKAADLAVNGKVERRQAKKAGRCK